MGTVAAKNYFADMLGALSGVRKFQDNPPDSLNVFPAAVAWVRESRYRSQGKGILFSHGRHVLVGQIHVARKNLPTDLATLEVYPDLFHAAVNADPTLGGNVNQTISLEASIQPGQWDSQQTLYVEFRLEVDIKYC